jgi:hypothetical protein
MTSRFWGIIPAKSGAAEGCFERPAWRSRDLGSRFVAWALVVVMR